MVELLYGQNAEGRMVHIDDVANGLACGCHCPSCGAMLIAKNNGESMAPHFAHYTGTACAGAHESELHMLAKEIIADDRCVMLPTYGNVLRPTLQRFSRVEVEKRNDIPTLQPDLCGVVVRQQNNSSALSSEKSEHRLWIEIMVTHAVGAEKRDMIRAHAIPCIEISMAPFMDRQVTRQEIREFLIHSTNSREWINNPRMEARQQQLAKEKKAYAIRMSQKEKENEENMPNSGDAHDKNEKDSKYGRKVKGSKCLTCKHHSTRVAIIEECRRRRLPAWVQQALCSDLTFWNRESIHFTISKTSDGYVIRYDGYVQHLPLTNPDMHGIMVDNHTIKQNHKVVSFLLSSLPNIIDTIGVRCSHCARTIAPTPPSRTFDVICNYEHRK